MKIIHIVENLDKGAVENWLVRVFLESRKTRPEWSWTFYCILGRPGRLDEQVIAAGGRIVYAPCTLSEKGRFLRHLRSVLREGHFDILHAHHDHLSGFYLTAGWGIRFKKRILHVHNTDRALPIGNRMVHDALLGPLRALALMRSDLVLGISEDTLAQFRKGWAPSRVRFALHYYGIDFGKFEGLQPDPALRGALGIPDSGKLLLYVGRMIPLKNPVYVVDILAALLRRRTDVYALFVGQGPDEEQARLRARALGVEDRIRLLGWRDDIPRIMRTADVFVFPRLEEPKEGLGLVVPEAQAAGLPVVVSPGIVPDAIEIPERSRTVPLRDNAEEWAGAVDEVLEEKMPVPRQAAFGRLHASKFDLAKATRKLIDIYES